MNGVLAPSFHSVPTGLPAPPLSPPLLLAVPVPPACPAAAALHSPPVLGVSRERERARAREYKNIRQR